MNERYEVSKPTEGMKTLSAQFSLLRLEKTIKSAKKMRLQGKSEDEVTKHIYSQHSDLDLASRQKIYQLTLGQQPRDDISQEDIDQYTKLNETTLELTLKVAVKGIQEGSFIFFEAKRWVVVGLQNRKLDLKQV